MHNSTVTGKGFINSTAALLTGIGTLLAALVALAILLVGEGVLFQDDGSEDSKAGQGSVGGGAVEFAETYGFDGTDGIELDGEKGIIRNPGRDPDLSFFTATRIMGAYSGGAIAVWTEQKQPSREDCAKLLQTHGASGSYDIEIGARFCVRSSGGRTAFLAVISDGNEYRVHLWK